MSQHVVDLLTSQLNVINTEIKQNTAHSSDSKYRLALHVTALTLVKQIGDTSGIPIAGSILQPISSLIASDKGLKRLRDDQDAHQHSNKLICLGSDEKISNLSSSPVKTKTKSLGKSQPKEFSSPVSVVTSTSTNSDTEIDNTILPVFSPTVKPSFAKTKLQDSLEVDQLVKGINEISDVNIDIKSLCTFLVYISSINTRFVNVSKPSPKKHWLSLRKFAELNYPGLFKLQQGKNSKIKEINIGKEFDMVIRTKDINLTAWRIVSDKMLYRCTHISRISKFVLDNAFSEPIHESLQDIHREYLKPSPLLGLMDDTVLMSHLHECYCNYDLDTLHAFINYLLSENEEFPSEEQSPVLQWMESRIANQPLLPNPASKKGAPFGKFKMFLIYEAEFELLFNSNSFRSKMMELYPSIAASLTRDEGDDSGDSIKPFYNPDNTYFKQLSFEL